MKKYNIPFISQSFFYRLSLLLFFCIAGFNAVGQTVNVSINILPPYSPYYSDYAGPNAAKVMLTLQNLSGTPQVLKLTGKLQGDNGVTISTRNNYVPLQRIVLGPHEVRQMNGTSLKDIFDLNNLNVLGIDKVKLAMSSRIPEGNYSFCIQAADYATGTLLSATAPLGCTQINITYPDAPILINPAPMSQVTATTPQVIVFNWMNAGAVPLGTQYTIQLAEMPDVAKDPNQVLNATALPMLSQTVSSLSYLYSLSNLGLTPGKKYAWRVIASDPTGKTLFKNNGISGASYFIYGDNDPAAFAGVSKNIEDLNIISPSCDQSPSIVIGDHLDLNIGWLWREQLASEQYFGTLDTALLQHYTQMPNGKGMVSIGKYKLDFHRVTNVNNTGSAYENLTFQTTAPQQTFTMTYMQAVAQRFVPGERYTVTITALDQNSKQLGQTTSCEWLLQQADKKALPKLNVKGHLTYSFDKMVYNGANNASITLQLTDLKSSGQVDMSKDFVSVTTDAYGNFQAQLTQSSADTVKKRLLLHINNPYYLQPDTTILIGHVPLIRYQTINNSLSLIQDTLKVGDIKTLVYSNKLTLNIKKGFPTNLNNKDYNTLMGGDTGYGNDIFIDTKTIDTMARVPDGLKVTLFRKAKAADIPAYEGDLNKTLPLKMALFPGIDPVIKVAEAVTQGGAQGKSQVVFNNLLCNLGANDTYYIQLQLPKDVATQQAELYAPQMAYQFKPLAGDLRQSFTNTANYNIISEKPPTAHVKGKVMYQWPSQPGVLHPYANKVVYVTEKYKVYNASGSPVTDPCVLGSTKFSETAGNRFKSQDNNWDLKSQNQDMEVGQVMTDANGNFDVEILVSTKMGQVDNVKISNMGTPCPPLPQKDPGKIIAQPIKKINGDPYESINIYGNSIFQNNQFNFNNAGFNNQSLNQMLGGAQGNANFGAQKSLGGGVQLNGLKSGPANDQDDLFPADKSFVERYFQLTGIPAVSNVDSAATTSAAHFVVQPFQTIDLGTVITNVDEIKDYKVYLNTFKHDEILAGAKMIVYRSWLAKNHGYIPDGEGSLKHPVKPLISPVFKLDNTNEPAEWVIDTAISVTGNVVNLGNRKLYNSPTVLYAITVSPNPEGAGGYFIPVQSDIYYTSLGLDLYRANSRIAGRIINGKTSKPIAGATARINIGGKFKDITADAQGYFEILNNQFQDFTWGDNSSMVTKPIMQGYKQSSLDTNQNILAKGGSYYRQLVMIPNKSVSIQTVDAADLSNNTNVPGYAMTPDSTITDNDNNEKRYHLYLTDNSSQTVRIMAKDPAYFDETITIAANQSVPPPVKMYKRHHRMQFRLFNPNMVVSATQFKILINNKPYEPVYHNNKADGTINFDFENISVNNYTIQVFDVSGVGFIPKIFNLQNQESKDFVNYDVRVEKGASVSGIVTLDKKTVANARVYLDYQTDKQITDLNKNGSKTAASLLEAKTDKNGYYVIKGIPVTETYKVTVHATLDTNVTVNGAIKEVNVVAPLNTIANFELATFNGLNVNNIYGFPLSIEHIEKVDNLTFKVTGLLDLGKNNQSPFKMLAGAGKVRVADVLLTTKNLTTWEPLNSAVKLDGIASLKMNYLDQYNVKLESAEHWSYYTTPLSIKKSGNGGAIDARVSLTDNSFNYPSTYLSFMDPATKQQIPFYLYNPASRNKGQVPVIQAIYNTPAQNTVFHLSDAKNDSLRFSFISFADSKAAPENSYIDPTTKQIHLDITFKGKVPHSNQGYVNVHVKDVALDGYSIKPAKGAEPLAIDLQSWKLYVKDWAIDPKLGGISATNSYIATGIIDIPAKTFNLRSDFFVLDDFDVENIALGGGLVKLNGIQKQNTFLVFDDACGSDHSAHWRFSAIGQNNQSVATIPLPAVANKVQATNIGVNYFQLVSYNNENIINLSASQKAMPLYNNQKFTFLPTSITSGVGTYNVTGTASFALPRVGSQAVSLTYKRSNGTDDMDVSNFLPINFEGKGYVQFTSNNGALFKPDAKKGFVTTIAGKVVEPGKFNKIPCTLTFGQKIGAGPDDATTDLGTITLQQGYQLRMDGKDEAGPNSLSLTIAGPDSNRMAVDAASKDWGTLRFSGTLNDPQSNSTANSADAMQSDPTKLSFNVLGDLSVTSSQIKMQKVKTPLGDLSLVYDFPTYTLRGSLHMKKVKFGAYDFTGDIQTTMGPQGLLMLGAGKLNTGTLFVDGFGVINIGVLFGNRDLDQGSVSTVTQYSKAKNGYCWLEDNMKGFKGFYLTGGLDVLDKHSKFNFVVASGYFNANLGVEASIGANFNSKSYLALLGAHGDVNAGLNSITGTTITGGLKAHLTGMASYNPEGFGINGDAGITIKYQINQYVPFVGTQHIGGQKGARVNFGYGGGNPSYFDFSLAEDGNTVTCTKKVT